MPLEALQNGRYQILRPIGSGSMGEVYLVEDTRINRQVAIKVIRTDGAAPPGTQAGNDAARLFEREARAIARLNHPHILPLFDFGEEVVNGTSLTYMVMPYCPEGSLATWLQQRGDTAPLSSQDVMHFVRQAADALQHAHDNDIIHQDVKPQNFLLRSNKNASLPDLLLADFGIAKLAASTSGASQAVRGTPIYMAPEQWEGHPVPASDQYALAVMAYQLLTGRPPFQGGPGQMMYQHFNVTPLPPSTFNPAIGPDIDNVILHALAKRPEGRFPSISAFSQALQQAQLAGLPTVSATRSRSQADLSSIAGAENALRATLTISQAEARDGTSRIFTLASGQRIRATIPPGVQNGQVVPVNGQDLSSSDGTTIVPLLLTLSIAPTGANYPPAFINEDQAATGLSPRVYGDPARINNNLPPTALPANQRTNINSMPTVMANTNSPAVGENSIPPTYSDREIQRNYVAPRPDDDKPPARRGPSPLTFLIIGLILLLILGSSGLAYYYYAASNSNANNANATATSQANAANNSASATALANDQGTAQANANATSTSQAQLNANGNATATANADASRTADANASGTADANATANAASTNATATAVANGTATAISATATASASVTAVLPAPTQISPANGTVFNNNPRTTTLQWSAVSGAASYGVEVDYYQSGDTSCTGGTVLFTKTDITDTSYTFNFVGPQPGCWRVWAISSGGQQGTQSGWWEFSYSQ